MGHFKITRKIMQNMLKQTGACLGMGAEQEQN